MFNALSKVTVIDSSFSNSSVSETGDLLFNFGGTYSCTSGCKAVRVTRSYTRPHAVTRGHTRPHAAPFRVHASTSIAVIVISIITLTYHLVTPAKTS